MIDEARLITTCAAYAIDVRSIAPQLALYARLLVSYNEKVNLTAITDDIGIENKHFLDSLLFAANERVRGKLVDVGTGAGFPGVVAKLLKPDIELTLMDPTGKRMDFLRMLCRELGVDAVFAKERAEEAARKTYRETFDVATARAVANLPALFEYCVPLVKAGGYFIPMKGEHAAEVEAAKGAAEKLNCVLEQVKTYNLPDGSARSLIIYKKISQNSTIYPRQGAKIEKSPLK